MMNSRQRRYVRRHNALPPELNPKLRHMNSAARRRFRRRPVWVRVSFKPELLWRAMIDPYIGPSIPPDNRPHAVSVRLGDHVVSGTVRVSPPAPGFTLVAASDPGFTDIDDVTIVEVTDHHGNRVVSLKGGSA